MADVNDPAHAKYQHPSLTDAEIDASLNDSPAALSPEEVDSATGDERVIDKTLDGDTLRVALDEGHTDLRSFGVDAPEKSQGLYGAESSQLFRDMTAGKKVRVKSLGTDPHGREIARTFLEDGTDVNLEMVKRGMSVPYPEFWEKMDPEYSRELMRAAADAKDRKVGYYGTYSDNSNAESPSDYRRRKDIEKFHAGTGPNPFLPMGKEKARSKEGVLERAGGALDYLNNVVRSGLEAGISTPGGHKFEGGVRAAVQALEIDREVDAYAVRDAITNKLRMPPVRFGVDNDDEWTVGDAVDIGVNVALDTLTDPLTWATEGIAAVGTVPYRLLKATEKGLSAVSAAKAAKVASYIEHLAPAGTKLFRSQMVEKAITGGIGAAVGFGSTDNDDSFGHRIGMTAAGFAAGAGALKKPAGALLKRTTGKDSLREVFNGLTERYAEITGRGVTKETDEAGNLLHETYKDYQSGQLRKDTYAEADRALPPVKGAQALVERQRQVHANAEALLQERLAPVKDYLRREAEVIVDKKYKFDGSPEDLARREQLVTQVGNAITEVRLGGMKVTAAVALDKTARARVEELARTRVNKRYEALDGADDAAVNDFMRQGKELQIKNREELFKKHDFDPRTMIGNELYSRVARNELSNAEMETLIETSRREHFQWKQKQLDELTNQGKNAAELTSADRAMQLQFEEKVSGWQRGFIPAKDTKSAFMTLNGAHTAKMNGLTAEAAKHTAVTWEDEALKALTQKSQDAVEAWKKNNREFVEQYNKEALGLEQKDFATRGIQGIDWHTSDVFSKEIMDDAGELLNVDRASRFKMAEKQGGTKAHDVLGEDVAYQVYAKESAQHFLTKTEQQAMKTMAGYRLLLAKQPMVQRFETVLRGYDKMMNLAKANMLYFSMSWMKNNYWDNLAKAFVEGGLDTALEASMMGLLRSGLRNDIWKLSKGEFKHGVMSKDLSEAVALGVLDGPAFNALIDEKHVALLNKDNPALEQWKKNKAKESEGGYLAKMSEHWVEGLQNSVGRIGSYVEGSARYITWKHVRDGLLKDPKYADQAAQAGIDAAEIVKKTFFDYGDVTMFETAVFKRLIPFYSFYSKNLPYWAGLIERPKQLGRLATLQGAREQVGDPLTERDRQSAGPYLLGNHARRLDNDEKGNNVYAISPSFSMDDALNMLFDPTESVTEKTSPLLKLFGYELPFGKDTFVGGSLLPSQIVKDNAAAGKTGTALDPKKFLYSRGFTQVLVQQVADAITGREELFGIKVDHNGNPYSTKDNAVAFDKIVSTVFPIGFIDQLAGMAGQVKYDKMDLMQAIRNRLFPIQVIRQSQNQAAYQRHISEANKNVD